MVLQVGQFRLHRSLRKTLAQFIKRSDCEIRIDSEFIRVIQACATTPRPGQPGTWIVPDMVQGYTRLHQAGFAHSVETWVSGELVGGLYCVALGRAVFGESMFSLIPDSSKLALAALVAFCREHRITHIDCQQKTAHLAAMGAAEMPRAQFLAHAAQASTQHAVTWRFSPVYWDHVVRR
jgi:leucyl/phenylalanyl-tRNA--protein transferase